MISIGDTVEFNTWHWCEVLDIRDGKLVIRPYCDAIVTVDPSRVRLIKRAEGK